MHNSELILVALVLLSAGAMVIRALVTGRSGFGEDGYDRHTQPAEFWFAICVLTIVIPLWLFLAIAQDRRMFERMPPPLVIVIPVFAFWLIRLLQKGKVRIGFDDYERDAAPGVYWTIVIGCAAFLLAFVALTSRAMLRA